MRNVTLMLVYERPGQTGIGLARITNRQIIALAARGAISEAAAIADDMGKDDPVVAEIGRGEVYKLRRSLGMLIPELQQDTVSVM